MHRRAFPHRPKRREGAIAKEHERIQIWTINPTAKKTVNYFNKSPHPLAEQCCIHPPRNSLTRIKPSNRRQPPLQAQFWKAPAIQVRVVPDDCFWSIFFRGGDLWVCE
jgi:hypothetical protein